MVVELPVTIDSFRTMDFWTRWMAELLMIWWPIFSWVALPVVAMPPSLDDERP